MHDNSTARTVFGPVLQSQENRAPIPRAPPAKAPCAAASSSQGRRARRGNPRESLRNVRNYKTSSVSSQRKTCSHTKVRNKRDPHLEAMADSELIAPHQARTVKRDRWLMVCGTGASAMALVVMVRAPELLWLRECLPFINQASDHSLPGSGCTGWGGRTSAQGTGSRVGKITGCEPAHAHRALSGGR